MIKFIIGVIAVAIIALIGQSYLPWWIIAPTSFLIGALLGLNGRQSFGYGFLGIALLWGVYAGWLNNENESILATKMGALFGGLSPLHLVLITALLGGIVGGVAAMTGSLGRNLFADEVSN